MFNIGFGEIIVVSLAIFMLFGPEAFPKIARTIGQWLHRFKKGLNEIHKDLDHQ